MGAAEATMGGSTYNELDPQLLKTIVAEQTVGDATSEATLKFKSGSEYSGQLLEGSFAFEGKGSFSWSQADGVKYEGSFARNAAMMRLPAAVSDSAATATSRIAPSSSRALMPSWRAWRAWWERGGRGGLLEQVDAQREEHLGQIKDRP